MKFLKHYTRYKKLPGEDFEEKIICFLVFLIWFVSNWFNEPTQCLHIIIVQGLALTTSIFASD